MVGPVAAHAMIVPVACCVLLRLSGFLHVVVVAFGAYVACVFLFLFGAFAFVFEEVEGGVDGVVILVEVHHPCLFVEHVVYYARVDV